jgi:hypothetical protein
MSEVSSFDGNVDSMSEILKRCVYNEKYDSFTTPAGIITFAAVAKKWRNREAKEGDEGAYILTLIIPPAHKLDLLKTAVDKRAKEKIGKTKGINTPFSEASEKLEEDRMPEGFNPEGWTMVRSNTYQKRPGVIFAGGDPVPEDELLDEVYNGRWARMTVKLHDYKAQDGGKPGVKLYLSNIQLLQKGEKWPGGMQRVEAHDEFESIELDGDADAVFDEKPAPKRAAVKNSKPASDMDDDIPF